MAIFNSNVKLPEGTVYGKFHLWNPGCFCLCPLFGFRHPITCAIDGRKKLQPPAMFASGKNVKYAHLHVKKLFESTSDFPEQDIQTKHNKNTLMHTAIHMQEILRKSKNVGGHSMLCPSGCSRPIPATRRDHCVGQANSSHSAADHGVWPETWWHGKDVYPKITHRG